MLILILFSALDLYMVCLGVYSRPHTRRDLPAGCLYLRRMRHSRSRGKSSLGALIFEGLRLFSSLSNPRVPPPEVLPDDTHAYDFGHLTHAFEPYYTSIPFSESSPRHQAYLRCEAELLIDMICECASNAHSASLEDAP